MVAAAGLLLAVFLQVPHALQAHFGEVSAPPPSYYRPGVPLEAFSYTKQTKTVEPSPENSDETPKQAGKKETLTRIVHSGKVALAALNRSTDPQNSTSNQSSNVFHLAQLPAQNQ